MKLSYPIPIFLLCAAFCLPSCEYDKVNTTVEYYSPEEYQVLSENLNLPATPFNYNSFSFGSHDIDGTGTLGRVLFYDTRLSSDNTVSCGSCHQQHLGFADNKAFSTGIQERSTARNTLALGAFRSFGSYSSDPRTTLFWDGRVDNLHDQMIQTIRNPNEMGMEMNQVVNKISGLDYYKILSKRAFGSEQLSDFTILLALENFMNSINSNTSKFDVASFGVKELTPSGLIWKGFNEQENRGKDLFLANCVNCHSQGLDALTFVPQPVLRTNNGLALQYTDHGAGTQNPDPTALDVFKVPGLRNIELTGPYMHDGRFNTLEEVVNFYSEGIQDHVNLDPLLKKDGHAIKFNFTPTEKDALVQFLKTLTDHSMTEEVKWSDPFL